MNDERLGRDGDSLESRLLRAGDGDGPPASVVQKTLLAVTAGVGAAGGTSTAAAGGAATLLKIGLLKWIGVGVLGVAVVIGGRALTASNTGVHPLDRAAPALVEPVRLATERVPAAALVPAPQPAETEPAVREPAPAPALAPPRASASGAEAVPEASSSRDTLRDELALLDQARSAVSAHDGARALSLISEYQKQFPKGRLYPELTVLRVQALLLQGRRVEAESLARKFLSASPNSPSAKRLRSLTGIRD